MDHRTIKYHTSPEVFSVTQFDALCFVVRWITEQKIPHLAQRFQRHTD